MSDALWWRWNGWALVPLRPDAAAARFWVGSRYLLEEHNERSHARHAAYFAELNTAWHSLPEIETNEYRSAEHLRKRALIETGWFDERTIVCDDARQAEHVATYVSAYDDYAVVTVASNVVRIWTAKSQSYRAMGKAHFNQSMEDVLNWVAGLLQVQRAVLDEQGEMA